MRVISTYLHGIFDYVGGLVLLLAPNLFGFAEMGGPAVIIPRVLGVIVLLQALVTDYELGAFKVLPMRAHLINDYVASLFLAASPWIFGFNDEPARAWVPHVVVGLAVFALSMMTEQVPRRHTTGIANAEQELAERRRRAGM